MTVEESIPPDRNAPSGTSATICWRTVSTQLSVEPLDGLGRPWLNGLASPSRMRRGPTSMGLAWPAVPSAVRVEKRAGRELEHASIDRHRCRDVTKPHELGQRVAVNLAAERRVGPQGLQFGPEQERVAAQP